MPSEYFESMRVLLFFEEINFLIADPLFIKSRYLYISKNEASCKTFKFKPITDVIFR